MTTITIERNLLEQVLDVLITRGAQPGYETERAWLKTVKSLEAALSAPATALEQHRPFVPWSKEAEMVASRTATVLEAELAATEIAIAEYRQQCLDNATEIARLRSESEERLQNCAALVAENERLRKDAKRYQWLAEYLVSDDESYDDAIVAATTVKEVDSVIDAAMGASPRAHCFCGVRPQAQPATAPERKPMPILEVNARWEQSVLGITRLQYYQVVREVEAFHGIPEDKP